MSDKKDDKVTVVRPKKEIKVIAERERILADTSPGQGLFSLTPEPMMSQPNPATEALFELTNIEKIKLMSQTDDAEISRIVAGLGLGRALELVGVDVMEDLDYLISEKFQMRVSNKRLGRAEQIEGVRSESGSSAPVINFGDDIRTHFEKNKVIKK